MTDKKAQKRGKISQQKGKEYEKFVSEVYNWLNDILISYKTEYKIERNKDKDTGEIDIYFEYKLPNGMNKTLIECKYGKFEKKDMFAFISKIDDKGGNMHGIFVYNDEKYLTDGIKELAERNNIELRHIPIDNGCIKSTWHSYRQYSLFIRIDERDGQKNLFYNIRQLPFDKDGKRYVIHYDSPIQEWFEKNKTKAVVLDIPKELSDKFLFQNLPENQKQDIFVDINGNAETKKIIAVGLINDDVKYDGTHFSVDKNEFECTVFCEYIATFKTGEFGFIIGNFIVSPLRKPIE